MVGVNYNCQNTFTAEVDVVTGCDVAGLAAVARRRNLSIHHLSVRRKNNNYVV